jgi:hypothetical protein
VMEVGTTIFAIYITMVAIRPSHAVVASDRHSDSEMGWHDTCGCTDMACEITSSQRYLAYHIRSSLHFHYCSRSHYFEGFARSRSTTSSKTARLSFSACILALFTLLVSASVCRVTHHVTSVTTAQAATSAIALAKLSRYLGAYLDLKICGPWT